MARDADIWSCYPEQRSHVDELAPRLAALEAVCDEVGRDPATLRRSAGVEVRPLAKADDAADGVITGSAGEISDALRTFHTAGFTQLEFMLYPVTTAALEAMAPVLELLDAD